MPGIERDEARLTRLLVSVRNAREAKDALAGGADLIDVKEPLRGSLGMADPAVWREAAEAVAGRAPLSVALGELREFRSDTQLCLPAVQFAKLGLAGCAAIDDWPARWASALNSLPPRVGRVAVSYADWRQAEAPPPRAVIEAGHALGCRAWLIDTYAKHAGGLLDHIGIEELEELIASARRAGMLTVLAGSLTRESIPRVLPLAPDYIAVRGAVCRGGREGILNVQLVSEVSTLVGSGVQNSRRQDFLDLPRTGG
jgi:uncharacterized protein (UPF0264 family)